VRNNSTWAPSPLLPTNWSREAWHPLLTFITFVGAVAIFVVAQTAYVLYAVDVAHTIDPNHVLDMPGGQLLIVQFVSWTPVALYLLLIVPALAKTSLAGLGFRAPTARDLQIALAGTLVMAIVVTGTGSIVSTLLHRHDVEQSVALLDTLKTPMQRGIFFFLACVCAPFYEELAFRAFIYNALTRYLPIPAALLASGLVFGLLHVSEGGFTFLTVGLPLVFGGIILGYVYATTKCFWANFITHAGFNAIGVIGILFFHVN
jgi:membrane protease YdiL (CAAX protease family)